MGPIKHIWYKRNRSCKDINENIEKYHKNLDNLANKLIVSREQDIRPMNDEVRSSMYLGGKTRRHRKHIKN